ncbi:MAG: methyltransferase [Candidatus Schekmanbacteria bacterium]|nr:methyltransferase [Candidatus Schekmanbacteria bacterium]
MTLSIRAAERLRALARRGLRLALQALWLGRHRHALDRVSLERVGGLSLVILPGVFNPVIFRSGVLLADAVRAELQRHEVRSVLDLGTGSGIVALTAQREGGASVTAVDIHGPSVCCARINAMINGCDHGVDFRQGDLFAPVAGETFDLVTFNPPFFEGEPTGPLGHAWRAHGMPDRFAQGLQGALSEHGQALVVLSTDGVQQAFLAALENRGLTCSVARRKRFLNETMTVFRLTQERES